MKMEGLPAQRTGHLYLPGTIPGTRLYAEFIEFELQNSAHRVFYFNISFFKNTNSVVMRASKKTVGLIL
jgi:hypothetical protein